MGEYSNSRATMSVETLEDKYHVVHLTSGCSLDLMKQVFAEYQDKHLFACVAKNHRVNKIAARFGVLVHEYDEVNVYHIKGD